jgi:hypothetical protein
MQLALEFGPGPDSLPVWQCRGLRHFTPSAIPGCVLVVVRHVDQDAIVSGVYLASHQPLPSRGSCLHYVDFRKARHAAFRPASSRSH